MLTSSNVSDGYTGYVQNMLKPLTAKHAQSGHDLHAPSLRDNCPFLLGFPCNMQLGVASQANTRPDERKMDLQWLSST